MCYKLKFIFSSLAGNVMIQKKSDCEVKVKVLDFGNAGRIDSKGGLSGIKSDVLNALRTFSALYLGEEFQSQLDLEQNWKQRVLERVCTYHLHAVLYIIYFHLQALGNKYQVIVDIVNYYDILTASKCFCSIS